MVIHVTKHGGEIIVYIYIHIPMNPIPLSARWYLLDVLQRPTILGHEPATHVTEHDGTGKSMVICQFAM